jgi:uncharacterized repeat protein (TIGR03803 family)
MKSGTLICVIPVALALVIVLVSAPIETLLAQVPSDNAASTYKVLYAFTGGSDGRGPIAGLVQDSAGNIYGTTEGGGIVSSLCKSGCGVAYKVDTTGKETVLHRFTGLPTDGAAPWANLTWASAGKLYGTASQGGSGNCYVYTSRRMRVKVGCGVVFELDTTGRETVLYNFTGGPDGRGPMAGLVQDSAGNVYGTTLEGGTYGYGTVFKLDTTGKATVLHSFDYTDGVAPYAGLVRDRAGSLYGTTNGGGTYGIGVVFKLDATGKYTILHSFLGYPSDGGNPYAGLIRDGAGNLYGTTSAPAPGGVVFKLDPTAKETILYNFLGHTTNGASPYAGLLMDSAGNLYGTTQFGGGSTACSGGCGVVFKLAPTGEETVLHSFTGGADGSQPSAGLVRDSAGNLYGTAFGGSSACSFGCGVVFKLTP